MMSFRVALFGLVLLAEFSHADVPAAPGLQTTKPNILVILADDLGYTDLGAFGGEIATPNLDSLAQQGIRLTNFHTSASCAPTRAMLMTGTDNHIAGIGSQMNLQTPLQAQHPQYRNVLLPSVPTVAEMMRQQGYRTYMAGKWHIGRDAQALPTKRGFDRSVVLLEGGGGHFDTTPLFYSYGQATWLENDQPVQLPEKFYSSDYLTDKLISYVGRAQAEQPFFAVLAFTAPHWPLQAPASDIAKYRGKYDAGWDVLREQRLVGAKSKGVVPGSAQGVHYEAGMVDWNGLDDLGKAAARARMEVYAAMIDRLDQNVGRLLAQLTATGQLENTVIVFSSDNGAEAHDMEERANRDGWLDANFDNSSSNIGRANSYTVLHAGWARATAVPFRASKSKVSEGGIRVPAFVYLPDQLGGAVDETDDSYMRIMDLAPTFVELAGGVPDENLLGRSLLARWHGQASPYDNQVIAFEVYGRRGAQRGPWKVLLQEAPFGTGQWQLYNLDQDLGEQNDLSDQHPEVRAELISAWQAYADKVGVVLPETPIYY